MNSSLHWIFLAVLSIIVSGCHPKIYDDFKNIQNEILFPNQDSVEISYKRKPSTNAEFSKEESSIEHEDNNDIHSFQTLNFETVNQKEFSKRDEPKCAHGEVYCTVDEEYDDSIKKRFQTALQKSKMTPKTLELLSGMLIDPPPQKGLNRFGGGSFLEDSICAAKEEVIFPRRGFTQSNKWVFIFNDKESIQQGVKVEKCLNTSGVSRFQSQVDELNCGAETMDGREAVCHQKYIYRNMLTMAPSGNSITSEAILIPSCCVCMKRIIRTGFRRSRRRSSFNTQTKWGRY